MLATKKPVITSNVVNIDKKKSIHQELEREACEELQREDGLRSPSGVEFTLLDVPGGRVDVLRAL